MAETAKGACAVAVLGGCRFCVRCKRCAVATITRRIGPRSRVCYTGRVVLTRFERDVVVAELEDTVLVAAGRMRDHRVGCLVVVRDRRPIGILTDRDLVLRVVAEGRDPAAVRVSEVVTYEATTVRQTDGIETAIQRMRTHGVRRIPIVNDDGQLTGIVTADDIVSLLTRQLADVGVGIEENVDGSESR